jgi:pimeloyl-ACP methyl ester carboxylesterase
MTLFIDLRATPSGGIVASAATLWEDGTTPLSHSDFAARIRGRDVLLATHGFNVDRQAGITALSAWSERCTVTPSSIFVGVLWPGDSRYLPIIDYPLEGREAIASGQLLASLLNQDAVGASSISFVSHSLGARVILEAAKGLARPVRRLILMAGAIENDCLTNEYQAAAANAQEIAVLASRSDWVLQYAFPAGNLVGEILMQGHPYYKVALGREGPATPIAAQQLGGVLQIPDAWAYVHGDYLPSQAVGPLFPPPVQTPAANAGIPLNPPPDDWKPSWSAGVVSSQLI